MYKIMFVDDDLLVLRRLHQILDWDNLQFVILPDAHDGKEAVSYLKENVNNQPDIIITDINMPNMNGLELASYIRINYPSINCIILTINDSFQCAQDAVNIGVYHYLLKPIEKVKLENLINKLSKKINSSQEQQLYISKLKDKANLSDQVIKENFLNWVISGYHPLDNDILKNKFNFYQIPINATDFQLISIHVDSFDKDNYNESIADTLVRKLITQINDYLFNYKNLFVFADPFNHLNILLGKTKTDNDWSSNSYFIADGVHKNLLFSFNLPTTIYISRTYSGYQYIYRCYYDTTFLSEITTSKTTSPIVSYDSSEVNKSSTINLDETRTQILKHFRSHDLMKLNSYIHNLLIEHYNKKNFDTFNMQCVDAILTGIIFLQESKVPLTDIFNLHFNPLMEIQSMKEFTECETFISSFYEQIISYMKSNIAITSSQKLTEKCKELIQINIGNSELSVKWLASQLYINESHLSRQFKKEQNISLIKYIVIQRLNTAKKLLEDGHKNIQDISSSIGFNDSLYFSKCFKKEFGISPSKYGETF